MEQIMKIALLIVSGWIAIKVVAVACGIIRSRTCCKCNRDITPLEHAEHICENCNNE